MSGYLVSASGLSSRISERFVEGQMSDEPGLSAADVLRLSLCSDCFSDKHLFGVARSHQTTHFPARHLNERSGHRSVFGHFFGEWRKLLVQGEIRCRKDVGQSRDSVKIGVLLTYRGSRRPTQRDSVTTALVTGARWVSGSLV